MNSFAPDTEIAIRRFPVLAACRYDVEGAIIYGSRACWTHHEESDVAVKVMPDTDALVALLPVWLDEREHPENYSKPALLHNINREGIHL